MGLAGKNLVLEGLSLKAVLILSSGASALGYHFSESDNLLSDCLTYTWFC